MSGMASYTPGMEISGGSLGTGLGIAVGMALGLKRKQSDRLRLQPDVGWRAGRGLDLGGRHVGRPPQAGQPDLPRGRQQHAGRRPLHGVLNFEPLADKWQAFGWFTQRVDGNDIPALVAAFDAARGHAGPQPRVIICDTKMAKGVPFLEAREKSHFLRVEAG